VKFKGLIKRLSAGKPMLAVLVDPDKYNPELIHLCNQYHVSCLLVGGSLLEKGSVDSTIQKIKKISKIPVLIFPGSSAQLSKRADGLLLLSLLSGRNPDFLIGEHVKAAPLIRQMKLPVLSTAYLLVGKNNRSTTRKVTRTMPLDIKQPDTIINTCLAAEQLGFSAIYLEAGSGAGNTVPPEILIKIKSKIKLPVIVGGGINTQEKAEALISAGINMLVVGNALEKNVYLLADLSKCFPAR